MNEVKSVKKRKGNDSFLVGRVIKYDRINGEEPVEGIKLLFIAKTRLGFSTRKLGAAETLRDGRFSLPFKLRNARRWSNKRLNLYLFEAERQLENGQFTGFRSIMKFRIPKGYLIGMSYNLRDIHLNGSTTEAKFHLDHNLIVKKVTDAGDSVWRRRVEKFLLWFYSKLFAWVIALGLSFPKQERMSHNNGIAGRGRLRIVDNPEFPEHEFFQPGREFPIRVRHASATFLDDAMNCIRSIAIKFADTRFESPFDLQMNTGAWSLFWSAASFIQFAWLRREAWGVEYVEYNRLYPEGLEGGQKAVRRHASSFANLHYYAKTPFLFIGKDGVKRYAKYRVIPMEDEPETGIWDNPSDWDMSNQRVLPHETRGRNFLKYEYEDRIKREGARYRLQIQLREASENDGPEIFNNMLLWSELQYPWMDLAFFEVNEMLDWEESTLTAFSVSHMPKSLGILPAKNIFDYNSLNYMRSKSEIARKARNFSYKVFGMVPPIPDNDNRNVSGFGE